MEEKIVSRGIPESLKIAAAGSLSQSLVKVFAHSVSSAASGQSHPLSWTRVGAHLIAKSKQHSSSRCWVVVRMRCCTLYGMDAGHSEGTFDSSGLGNSSAIVCLGTIDN